MEVKINSDDYVPVDMVAGSLFRAQSKKEFGLMVVQADVKPRHDERGFTVDDDTILQDMLAGTKLLWAKLPGASGRDCIAVFEPR